MDDEVEAVLGGRHVSNGDGFLSGDSCLCSDLVSDGAASVGTDALPTSDPVASREQTLDWKLLQDAVLPQRTASADCVTVALAWFCGTPEAHKPSGPLCNADCSIAAAL